MPDHARSIDIEYNRRIAELPDVPHAAVRAQGDIAMPVCEIQTNSDNALDKVTSAMVILRATTWTTRRRR